LIMGCIVACCFMLVRMAVGWLVQGGLQPHFKWAFVTVGVIVLVVGIEFYRKERRERREDKPQINTDKHR